MLRFDDILLDKASKFSIDEVRKKFEDYIPLNSSNKIYQQFSDKISDLKQYVLDLEELQVEKDNNIVKSSKEHMNELMAKVKRELYCAYDVKPIDSLEFETRMALKANQEEIVSLDSLKADLKDQLLLKEH